MINFDNTYANLPPDFFQELIPRENLEPSLLYFNHDLANQLGINIDSDDELLANYFSFNRFMKNSKPLAMIYAGHQFGHFSPQLGDGRAVLLGEFIANNKQRYDIHLKGSGQTSYSRRGDGKSALGPSIREMLISEAMYHLGVSTSRTLCVVRTSEMVIRDKIMPGGVSTRIALSHLRIGTFEYFAAKKDYKNLKILADYAISRLYPELNKSEQVYFNLWKEVFKKQIKTIITWMSLGFIHGVMNTDNMNISGETIDYGPCAFMDHFNHAKVFSSIDHQGRYAYSNQPKILFWNMLRFAESMMSLLEVSEEELMVEVKKFQDIFIKEYNLSMINKVGLNNCDNGEEDLTSEWLGFLEKNNLDFTLSYIDLERFFIGKKSFTKIDQFDEFTIIAKKILKHETAEKLVKKMQETNPMLIPRNHQVEAIIQSCLVGNDQKFKDFLNVIRDPFTRRDELLNVDLPPEKHEVVAQTFCGT